MDIKLHTARSTDRPEVARIFEAMDAAHLLHTPIADWPPQGLQRCAACGEVFDLDDHTDEDDDYE